jgi:uncharacterized protein (TIGR02284 family)
MDNDKDIATLNSLIETTIDSADGYEQAAATEKVGDLAQTFRQFASERRSIVAELRGHVVRLGGNPEDDGTLLAAAHRQFLNLRSAFDSDTRTAINEVERGEDYIKNKYEMALKADLSPDVRQAIQRAYESIRAGHDTFSAMKKSYAA